MKKICSIFVKAGIQSKIYILDNEISEDLKNVFNDEK